MKLTLRFYPDEVLKKPTQKVKKFDKALKVLSDDMRELMFKERGIGLAAPQVGLSIKMMLCYDPDKQKTYTLINPEIIKESGEQVGPEGCLSFPDLFKEVKRPQEVIVKYQDVNGKVQILKAEGLLARCICHEKDHLDGILFIER